MKRFLFLFALSAVPVHAATPPPPATGHYQNWDNRVADLQLLQPFHLKDYAWNTPWTGFRG